MPADSQARMIQLLSVLSEMQTNRRKMDLAEREFEQQKAQTAQAFGFQEKSTQYKKMMDFLDMAARLGPTVQNDLSKAAQEAGLPTDFAQTVSSLALNAPQSLQQLIAQNAKTQMAAGNVNLPEAGNVAMTGHTTGDLAQSQMQGQAAQRVMATPQLMMQLAGIMGGNMSPYQKAEIGLGQQSANTAARNAATGEAAVRNQTIGMEMTTARDLVQRQMWTPQQHMLGLQRLQQIQRMMQQKGISAADKTNLMAQFNNLADQFGFSQLKYGSPNADPSDNSQLLDAYLQQVESGGLPGSRPPGGFTPAPGFAPQPQQPMAPFGQTPFPQFYNPLNPGQNQ